MVAALLCLVMPQLIFAHGMSEADKLAIIEGGNLSYLWLGATHMLTGYDHLAFVFGIIFFLTSIKDIAKYVTVFTVGHSITLIYATFNGIQLNYFIIDAIIGLSVSYIAFTNIDGFRKYLNVVQPNMLFMIGGLGLIHGFGLSSRLQELPLSEDSLLLNIISFNIGIELGQLTALVIMLLLITTWRKTQSFQVFSIISNYALILIGCFLFLMQMHGYEHSANSPDFSSAVSTTANQNISTGATDKSNWQNTITVTIPARGDKEHKFDLEKGETLIYSWKTDGDALYFDFHGEPKGDTTGYFKSFEKATDSRSTGSLTTTFTGPHGWYWKNSSAKAVNIELKSTRQFNESAVTPQQEPIATSTHESID